MPLPIELTLQRTAANLRDGAALLNTLADALDGLNLAEELLMAAPDIFRRLIDDDKAKSARVRELEAEKAQTDALATEAEALLDGTPPTPPTPPSDPGNPTPPDGGTPATPATPPV